MSVDINHRSETQYELNSTLLFSLLVACSLFIFVLPVIAHPVIEWVKIALFTAIVVLAASIASPGNKLSIAFAFVVILIEWITNFSDFIYIHYIAELTTNIFIVWVVANFVIQIMKRAKVTLYTMIEALLGYLLLGIMFTGLVSFIDLHTLNAYSIALDSDFDRGYYTLITLTTTGYGDITPLTPIAKSLSLLIAIFGQFYVAVIVAIIVGKYSNTLSSQSQ